MDHLQVFWQLATVVCGPVGSLPEHGKGHGHRGPGKPWNGGHAEDSWFRIQNHKAHAENERYLARLDAAIIAANARTRERLALAAENSAAI